MLLDNLTSWIHIMGHYILWPAAAVAPIVVATIILRRWIKWPVEDLAAFVAIVYVLLLWAGSCALPAGGS